LPADLCLLDGALVPLAEASIPPLDRGYLFGDAVYEAVKLRSGAPLFLDAHLERLGRSLSAMRIPQPPGIAVALERLLAAHAGVDGSLYLQVTRGCDARRSHRPSLRPVPAWFAMVTPIAFAAAPWKLPGLRAISVLDRRWGRCDIKTTALAASVLAKLEMVDAGADEVLFRAADGTLREGGNTNLFVRDGDGWHTHPAGPEILSGVTRAIVGELARAAGFELAERAPRLDRRAGWREALVCGTTTGVRGLVELDGEPIGDGRVGDATRALARALDRREREAVATGVAR